MRARVIHVRFSFSFFSLTSNFSPVLAPYIFIITLGWRTCVCVDVLRLCVNCYSTPLIRKLLDVMDTLYTRFFKYTFQFVLTLLLLLLLLFSHINVKLRLICSHYAFFFCVWVCVCGARTMSCQFPFQFLFLLKLPLLCSNLILLLLVGAISVCVHRHCHRRCHSCHPFLSPSLFLSFAHLNDHILFIYYYISSMSLSLCYFANEFFLSRIAIRSSWCDMKCLSNPIKASITHTHKLIDE